MIVVRIIGGIGNQLFQYFFGQYLEKTFKITVFYDIRAFTSVNKERSFELKLVFPDIKIYEGNDFSFSNYKGIKSRLLVFLFNLNKNNLYIKDCSIDLINKIEENTTYYFDGFWQETKMVDEIYPNLKTNFNLENRVPRDIADLFNEIENSNSVSVHIRRGDYFTPKNIGVYGVCTEKYYYDAIYQMEEKSSEQLKYFIFSDDIEWVKKTLTLEVDYVIVPSTKINSFWFIYLMSLCKHNIISNSSYSWWGAFLNSNSKKNVVAPKRWKLTDHKTIALDNWIRL